MTVFGVREESGNEVPLENVTNAMGRALGHYAQYIRSANQAEKEKDSSFGSDYYSKQTKDVAGTIKKIMMAFERGDANNMNRY